MSKYIIAPNIITRQIVVVMTKYEGQRKNNDKYDRDKRTRMTK